MNDEFDFLESSAPTFDIKAFLFRALRYWKLFLLCIGVGLFFAHQQNIRKQQAYNLSTQISIEDNKNPLFSSNTSLTFNWGGVSGKIKTIITTLRSRSIHEKVVDSLEYYVTYLKQSRFRKDDIYKAAPFEFKLTPYAYQMLNTPIKVSYLGEGVYELHVLNENGTTRVVDSQNFSDKTKGNLTINPEGFKQQFVSGDTIRTPFINGIINYKAHAVVEAGEDYYIRFLDFNSVVATYRNKLSVSNPRGSAILNLGMTDFNKEKIVDYLNTTVAVVSADQLTRKNQFVTNTIKFIDSQLDRYKDKITLNKDSLNDYRQRNSIFNLDAESAQINQNLIDLEFKKDAVNRQIDYYEQLKTYLETSNTFTNLPAPATAGVNDGSILANIAKINALSIQKAKYEETIRSDAAIFAEINSQIEAIKRVLLETISSAKKGLNRELTFISSKQAEVDYKLRKLPKDQQNMLGFQRQYALDEQTYNMFLSKRGEADILKAATVSDVLIIDKAKDTGAKAIDLNTQSAYFLAVVVGFMPPLLLAFLVTFFDNKLHNPKQLENISKIPLLGVIGKNTLDNNLVVHRKPKSAVAEAFRGIRSSLQFMYKKHDLEGSKTVMLTSSVSGEGKTFCAINIATVFALSGKKTILVGLDLRQPKIFGDFNIKNEIGAVNYLIGQKDLDAVTQATSIENLDVITSGPIPPNPSELLIGEKMDAFMAALKEKYDYVVLDTPPVGLVSDALELTEYVDASLYVARQQYTKKDMLNLINDKYKRGEIKNISLLYNGYDQKGKYGYGYGYGYGAYGNGYHENETKKKTVFDRLKSILKIS